MRHLLPPTSRSPGASFHPADGADWPADCRISRASTGDTLRQEALMAASKLISPCGSSDDTTNIDRWPAPVVLDQFVWIDGPMNRDTMATIKTDDGHILELSFWIHKSPALSYFCIHCRKGPNSEPKGAAFKSKPQIIAAEGHFFLLHTRFASSSGEAEYFMYKAGNSESGKLASLDRVPGPSSFSLRTVKELGIVPCDHGYHYLVAALCPGSDKLYYKLHIYSSKDEKWTTKLLQNPCPQLDKVRTSKVVTLGEGILGWVDFQHGMLMCNLHETNPTAHYIPLPDLLPENEDRLEESYPGRSARKFRDLACINGVVKLIEMEHHVVTTQKPSHPLISGKVYDSDVIMSRERKEPEPPSYNGWKALMWSRTLPSNCWEMGPVVDAADIIIDNSLDLSLLSGIMGAVNIDKIVFKDLYSAYPTLSTDGDDILYLALMGEPNNLDGRMAVIDLGTKRVKELGDYSLEMHSPLVKTFGPSTVPVVTTGKVPASACVHTNRANNSERDPNTASKICVGHPSSCGSDFKHPRRLAEKVNHGQYRAQNIGQNVHIKEAHSSKRDPNNTSICAGHPSSCGSDNKRPRLLAEKVDHGQCGTQNIVQNDISLVSPVQNNLAPQQHFINHYKPLYPQAPYTPLYAQQNNQHYFNSWDGSHSPGYALSAPPPKLPEYFNCQPLWQHSQPLEQQATYTSVFGPPEASQLCYNYCEGTSYHGHSQQFPANHQHLAHVHGLPVESWQGHQPVHSGV